MTSSTNLTSPLPSQETYVILHRGEERFLISANIVPLDLHNSRLFADWDIEDWELLRKLEWYRRPFVQDLLRRQDISSEKTFVVLTRLADFINLTSQSIGHHPGLLPNPLNIQIQAALTIEIDDGGSTTIYNIESAPWNKFGPKHRFISMPAAVLFFFAAQHHLATTVPHNKFILSHPTDDGIVFYQKKLQLKLRWSSGRDRYAVVERDSLLEALLSYNEKLEVIRQNLPIYRPE